MILSNSDFTGRWLIPINGVNAGILTSVIEDVEEKYLIMLLGADLYNSFIIGLAETTPLKKWTFLRDGGYYKSETGMDDDYTNVRFKGVKEMLKYFTWCEYMIKTRNQINTIGMMKPATENGDVADNQDFSAEIISKFNDGLEIYKDAIIFIMDMNFSTDIVSSNGNDIVLNYEKMFEGEEVITIGSNEYEVVSVSNQTLTLDSTPSNPTYLEFIFYRNFTYQPINTMTNV